MLHETEIDTGVDPGMIRRDLFRIGGITLAGGLAPSSATGARLAGNACPEQDRVGWDHLIRESCSRCKSVEPDSRLGSFRSEPIRL